MTAWTDVRTLTANQAAKLEQFRAIGDAVNNGQVPDISGVTDQQAKSGMNFLNQDMHLLVNATDAGLRYVRDFYKANALKTYDDGVIPGP